MKAHRFWLLLLAAGLSACISDNPTGLTNNGPNGVGELRMYQLENLLVADPELQCEVIDFNEFAGGTLNPAPINVLGDVATVEITGWVDSVSDCGTGDVVVFDTSVPSTVDNDLVLAGNSGGLTLLNVLTHQSCETDGIPGNDPNGSAGDLVDNTFIPNDADVMDTMRFTFPSDDWTILSFAALDQENDGEGIALFTDGNPSNTTNGAVNFADSVEVVIVDVNSAFNTTLDFQFNGSGAIDDLEICKVIERGGEGCTPGYWKQSQHFGSWSVNPYTFTFAEAFADACVFDAALQNPESGNLCDLTLLEALNLNGGGANALGRHAAAAWLNTQSVDFYYLQAEVETMVAAALEAGVYTLTKDALAEANEAGCPLARDEGDWTP
ncbi:MAG: hypothetical protein OEM96_02215 [Gemmatimonadota bacterium]|nr:hypothetical protein [Gemmatimonadota bacterium]